MKHDKYTNIQLQVTTTYFMICCSIIGFVIIASIIIMHKLDVLGNKIDKITVINNIQVDGLTTGQAGVISDLINAMQKDNQKEIDGAITFYLKNRERIDNTK